MNVTRHVPRQSRSLLLVEEIVDAAARVLLSDGHVALTTNAAAKEAGVSVGSLYRYFPNKEALVTAVIERDGRRFHDRIMREVEAASPHGPRELVGRIVEALADAYEASAADDPLRSVDIRRSGLFDRRIAALKAVTALLRRLDDTGEIDRPAHSDKGAPIIAEIIVALMEAATTRPSAFLSGETARSVTIAAAMTYVSGSRSNNDAVRSTMFAMD